MAQAPPHRPLTSLRRRLAGGVDTRSHVARVRGRRLAWLEAGDGPPIVLVHGLAASGLWWRPVLPALAARHRVLVVDLAGFGASSRQAFRLDLAADLLAAWLESIGVDRASFVGHSMGGFVAADLASRHPALVERLVLVDAAGMPLRGGVRRHLRNLMTGGRRMPARLAGIVVADLLRSGPVAIARAAHQVLIGDLLERMATIAAPTLVVWGERDVLIPPESGRLIATTIPGARFEMIANSGHNPMWEQPAELQRLILDFLEQPARSVAPRPAVLRAATPATRRRPAISSAYVAVGPHAIHVRSGGLGRPGRPIVLVHGFVISSRYLVPLMRQLARTRPVFAPDLPGFGWSSKPKAALDVSGLADALIAYLDAAGLDRPVLLGNSLGSQVVADAAARHPDRVAAVVLTGPTFDRSTPDRRSLVAHVLRLLADGPREKPGLWLLHVPDYVLTGLRRAIATLRYAWRDEIETKVPLLTMPTLVLRGGRDPLVSRKWVGSLATLAQCGRAAEVPEAAHAVNHGAPAALARVVEAFLSDVARDAAVPAEAEPEARGRRAG
ncbi:MAG: alpha/beta fold hydrolase [Chloroflexota bacterium]